MFRLAHVFGIAIALVGLAGAPNAGATMLASFGRCLASKGATLYGASWCGHCRAQEQTLGEAMDYVPYVECADDGDPTRLAATCRKAKVESYPTWTFADGSRVSGELSLAQLAAKTGCPLPGRRERSEPPGVPGFESL